jgi:hypothetical protein
VCIRFSFRNAFPGPPLRITCSAAKNETPTPDPVDVIFRAGRALPRSATATDAGNNTSEFSQALQV